MMYVLGAVAALSLAPVTIDAAQTSPEQVVQGQLEAYNAHDVDGFLAFYSPDALLYDWPEKVLASGRDAIRNIYTELFVAAPTLRGKVTNRIVSGNFVIDREEIAGFPNNRTVKTVAIYEVRDGLIRRVWFLPEE